MKKAVILCGLALLVFLLCLCGPVDAQAPLSGNSRQLAERVQKQVTELTKWIDKHVLLRFSSPDDPLSSNKASSTAKTFKKPSEMWEVRRVFQDQAPWRLNLAVFAKTDIPEGTVLSALDFDKTYNFRKLTTDFPGLLRIFPLNFWSENSIDEAVPLTLWMLLHKNVLKKDSELHPFLKTIWMLFEEFEGIEGLSSWGSSQEMVDIKHQILAHPRYPSGWYETKEAHEETAEGQKIIKKKLFSRNPTTLGLPAGTSWSDVIPSDKAWRVAYFLVRSRCWTLGGVKTLLPIFDLNNHDSAQAQAGVVFDGGLARMVSFKPIKKGDEIFISYGDHSAQDTLDLYGFMPFSNRSQEVSVRIRTTLIPHDALRTVFDPKFLNYIPSSQNGQDVVQIYYSHDLPVRTNTVPWELVDFFRICVTDNLQSPLLDINDVRLKWLLDLENNFDRTQRSKYYNPEVISNSENTPLTAFHLLVSYRAAFFNLIGFLRSFSIPFDDIPSLLEKTKEDLITVTKIFHRDLEEFKSISKNVQHLEHALNILSLRVLIHSTVESAQTAILKDWELFIHDDNAVPELPEILAEIGSDVVDPPTLEQFLNAPPFYGDTPPKQSRTITEKDFLEYLLSPPEDDQEALGELNVLQ